MTDGNLGVAHSPEASAAADDLVQQFLGVVPRTEAMNDMEFAQVVLCAAFQAVVRAANAALPNVSLGCALHAHGLAAGILMAEADPALQGNIKVMMLHDMNAGAKLALEQWEAEAAQGDARPQGRLDS